MTIPNEIRVRMHEAGERGAEEGVVIARDLIMQLRPLVQGLYLIPAFGRYDLAADVLEVVPEAAMPVL
jgi:homocysteine S-methyltransferase